MIKFVYQDRPKGTGDAVLKTKNIKKCNPTIPRYDHIKARERTFKTN